MMPFNQYIIDLRDFSYMAYARRYGRVSAKNWPGYKGLFILMYLPYYLVPLLIMKRFIPKDFYAYAQAHPFGVIEVTLGLLLLFLPYILLTNVVLTKWEARHPVVFKAIQSKWREKQLVGIGTLLCGCAAILLYFKLTELFG
jgi:hypothetical protein